MSDFFAEPGLATEIELRQESIYRMTNVAVIVLTLFLSLESFLNNNGFKSWNIIVSVLLITSLIASLFVANKTKNFKYSKR